MVLPELKMSLGGSILLLTLLFILAIGLTIFFYRTTTPPIPRRSKTFLAIVRALALTLLLFLIFEPLLKIIFHRKQNAVLAVLVDNSQSMTIKDRQIERGEEVRSLLKKNLFSVLADVDVRYYPFSPRLNTSSSFSADSLTFQGETTDLTGALAQLKEEKVKENIQAAVLISDGNYTAGKNPLTPAEELGMPLYVVGVGDTVEQRDVLISNLTTNTVAYAEIRVPVDVRVRSSGYKNEKVEVSLMQGTAVLDRKVLQLQEGTRDYTLSLSYEPKEEGVQKYTVSVSHLPGELTEKNNMRAFFVKVLKTKLRILLVAGAPSPDVSAVRQVLSEEEHYTVKAFVQKNTGGFSEGALIPSVVDSADCIILVGYPSPAAGQAQIQQLRDAIMQQKKPVLFIAAKTVDFGKLQMFESLLPFSWTAPSTNEFFVFAEVPEKQRAHVLVNLEGTVTIEGWRQLPPIFKTQTTFRAKPEADVLAFVRPERNSPGRQANVGGEIQSPLTEPLVLTRNIARQKSFAITGHGVWRWRLLTQGNSQTEKFFPLLVTNAVRWLTTLDEGKKVRVTPTKEAFTTAEPVEFTGEVYDEQFHAFDNAQLRLEILSKNQRVETLLRNIGSGRYEGSIEGLGAGDYSFTAKAAVDDKTLGEDKGKFSVGQINVEFLETKMNKPLLEQLAFDSGGMYADIAHASKLVDTIRARTKFAAQDLTHATELELWNWQYLAALIVMLLGIEWFVRKRSGML